MEANVALTAQRLMMLQDGNQESVQRVVIADGKPESVHKALLCSQLSRMRGKGERGKNTENGKESC